MAGLIRRGTQYYAVYRVGGRERRVSLQTESFQLAREKIRKIESALARGSAMPLPTRTPIAEILGAYVDHIMTVKTPRSARIDTFFLREAFGPICDGVKVTSRNTSEKSRKRPLTDEGRAMRKLPVIEANAFEEITTAQISSFLAAMVKARGLAPKTANRYREVICRVFNWAMQQRGIRTPDNRNPAAHVERYKEHAPKITFLTLPQIDEQLKALKGKPQLQAMVALYIYAGLRREEALWLTVEDIDFRAGPFGMIRVQAKAVEEGSWQPKTRVNRAVPVSRTLRAYLDRHFPAPAPGRWYFPSPEGKRYDPDNFSADLRAANAAAGLSWGCLDYRHTFGSQLAIKGESLYKISRLLGNSPDICRRHYAALSPEALTGSVEFPQPIGSTALPRVTAQTA